MDFGTSFPRQTLPYKQKGEKWRQACLDWASTRTYFNYSPIRKNVVNMKINYDLVNGVIHMEDIAAVLNPNNSATALVPDKIQHFPIINSKLNVLRGEELSRAFEWRAVLTNPNAISEAEERKKQELFSKIQGVVEDTSLTDEQASEQVKGLEDYYNFDYQDFRELQGNELLKHYIKEYNFPQIFNNGFMDACINSTEVYQVGICGGEPFLTKLNPIKLRPLGMGYSNKIEDAEAIIYEDYWSRSRIIDTYYDELTAKQIKWLSDELPDLGGYGPTGAAGNYNEAYPFISSERVIGEDGILDSTGTIGLVYDDLATMIGGMGSDLLPYDVAGNVRVLRFWWKSRRKILRVSSFDPITGEKNYDFYPETYIPDEDAGEEAEVLWVNEAWEGTKIGNDIYVGIRPCLVQHNSISNPSRCHFGIIGTIYNLNESMPYSLVDMMKPYNYMYDAIHAKLVDLIATNWGKLLEMDLALKPKGWEVDKWIYFAKANKVLIKDSFNEGAKGAATGKLAGGLNNATKGYIDADWGSSIQNYINLLQWTKDSMSDIVGINKQREGSIQNRETVGGIERAVMQSSYITDWLFQQHDDTKRRVLQAFLEEAAAAIRGGSKKFQYILSDGSRKIMEIDGNNFVMCDMGVIIDSSQDMQRLNNSIDSIAQAAMQGSYRLSALMRLYTSLSMREKIRTIEKMENESQQQAQQAQQMQQEMEQQRLQQEAQIKQMQMQQEDALNKRDNETKISVAEINARAEYLRLGIYADENNEELRKAEMDVDYAKIKADIEALDKEIRFKEKELAQKKEIEMAKIKATKQN